ncbi:Dual specificity protein kinase CLK1, partial [Chaetura pelagica]
ILIPLQARGDKEHLPMMERILGPLPRHMIKTSRCFHQGQLDWDEHSSAGRHLSGAVRPAFLTSSDAEHENLFDLMEKMLQPDLAEHVTLEEALKHPFFFPLRWEKLALPPPAAGTGVSPPE